MAGCSHRAIQVTLVTVCSGGDTDEAETLFEKHVLELPVLAA